MIRPIGFIDTSMFTARYMTKHKEKVEDGVLILRDFKGEEPDPSDRAILQDWPSARAMLVKLRAGAAPHFEGRTPEIGKVWLEIVPPFSGTPWTSETGDYADAHVRTRTCLIPCPGAMSFSGTASANLLVGMVNLVDHHALCSEINTGEYARVHLIADFKVPDEAAT